MEHYKLNGEIRCLANLIKRKVDADPIFAKQKEITGMHGYAIGFIYRRIKDGKKVYQKDLESAFNIRRSSATEMLNTMEQNGLIVRVSDDKDKRMKQLVLTEKAIQSHSIVISRLQAIDGQIMDVLTKEEQSQLIHIIDKLKTALKD